MASIAVLPILIGLAVDYAIQLQARYDEAVEGGASGAQAARLAAARGAPTIATACLATAAGFLALQLSPTPMVRGFGLLLVAGVAIAFALALTAGFAALGLRRERPANAPSRLTELQGRAGARIGKLSSQRLGHIARPFATRPRRRAGPGRDRLGSRDSDPDRFRYPLACPAEPPRAARPQPASGRNWRLRRARSQYPGPRPCRPRDDSLDGGLQAKGAELQRLWRVRAKLQRRRSLPRSGAVGLPHRRRQAERAGHHAKPSRSSPPMTSSRSPRSIRRAAVSATRR